MTRLPWWVRDLIYGAVFIAILLGVSYGIDRIPIAGMAYYRRIIVLMGINIILAVSLNIINGHAGQFSLGHAGFMAIGAYSAAFLTFFYFMPYVNKFPEGTEQWLLQNACLVIAVLAGGLVAALAGYVVGLPSLRLRGDYLAIVTLGFGEIIRVVILNIDKIGGARGLSGIPNWVDFFWVYLFCGITILISWRLVRSSVGRAFLAVREDEIAAEAMGVDTTRSKVVSFIVSSALAGIGGGLLGHYLMYLHTNSFTFIKSIEVIIMIVIGGLGSITGSVLGAVLYIGLTESLREFSQYRMVLFSFLLIVIMIVRPQGILGHWEFRLPFTKRRALDAPLPPALEG